MEMGTAEQSDALSRPVSDRYSNAHAPTSSLLAALSTHSWSSAASSCSILDPQKG